MTLLPYLVAAVVAYLLGSINSSIIISKIYAGDDVRNHGSGNAGMTNVLRTYGIKPAIFTALGDFLKGIVSVLLARYLLFPLLGSGDKLFGLDIGYVAGFFAIVGHVYPLYFKFKGGKAVMTSLGVISIVDPLVFVILLVITLPFVFKTRYVSLGSVLGAVCLPVITGLKRWLTHQPIWPDTLSALAIGLFVLYLHRGNLQRLLSGTENKFTPPKTQGGK